MHFTYRHSIMPLKQAWKKISKMRQINKKLAVPTSIRNDT